MSNISDNRSIVHPQALDHFECSRVENIVNQYRAGDYDEALRTKNPRVFPLTVKHLSNLMLEFAHEREEREKYFELFGWKPLRTEEDVARVPRDEILICRGRDAELPYYCVDALAADASAEELEQFFVDYDCYALVNLSPFPPMILEPVEENA